MNTHDDYGALERLAGDLGASVERELRAELERLLTPAALERFDAAERELEVRVLGVRE